MRVLQAFATDADLVEDGLSCDIEFQGTVICRVKVRPADPLLNADYRRLVTEMGRELKTQAGDQVDDPADTEKLYRLYAETIITAWEWTDPADQKDKSLIFNPKNAVAIFKKAPKFFEAIQRVARDWAQFRSEHEADAAGN